MNKNIKKKGFTLIELLAVIVILAIIALIVTPIIGSLIRQSRIRSAVASTYGFIEAVNDEVLYRTGKGQNISSTEYSVIDNTLGVEYKGKGPSAGWYRVDNMRVVEGEFCIWGYNVKYENGRATYVSDLNICPSAPQPPEPSNPPCTGSGCEPQPPCVGVECESEPPCAGTDCGTEPTGDYVRHVCEGTLDYDTTTSFYASRVEDLVCMSQLAANSKTFSDKKVTLVTNIDFKNDKSYVSKTSTTYGDINGDGTTEGLYKEVTTGAGFNPISSYSGELDGADYMIRNLLINRTDNSIAFIKSGSGSTKVYDLTFDKASVTGGGETTSLVFAGGYGGPEISGIKVTNSSVTGVNYTSCIIASPTASSVSNIELSNVSITSTGDYVGSIVAHTSFMSKLENIKVTNLTVSGNDYVGGIVGNHQSTTSVGNIEVYGTLSVTGRDEVGGIAGGSTSFANSSILIDTTSYNVSGRTNVGGLLGSTYGTLQLVNTKQINVTGTGNYIGGLIGYNYGKIVKSTSTKIVVSAGNDTTKTSYIGGIIGANYQSSNVQGELTSNIIEVNVNNAENIGGFIGYTNGGSNFGPFSANTVRITGSSLEHVGGVVGVYNGSGMNFNVSETLITVSNSTEVGGFAGELRGTLSNMTITGINITANSSTSVGGLAGYLGNTIQNITVAGNVSGDTNVGGIIGDLAAGCIVTCTSSVHVTGNTNVGDIYGLKGYGQVVES